MKNYLLCCLTIICAITTVNSQTFDVLKYNWCARADSMWGTVPAAEELQAFDSLWTLIDQKFACFQNLDLDWNALKVKYRPEIEKGVSRGRFAAILSQMSIALMETHTAIGDPGITNYIKKKPGLPVLFGGWGNDGSFGAGLTPLEDGTLLVYKSIPSHPLGLVPGDIILGYDGVPWKQLYPRLIQMELPISFPSHWGGNASAFAHSWLQAAGTNWHLFDTIDIIKYSTKDTLHLPTSLLIDKNLNLFCTEQLPVAGVPMTDSITSTKDVRWGIVQGTNIGYVYSWTWFNLNSHFRNAIDSLTRIYKVNGLVIDLRTNNGGYVSNADEGLSLLFKVAPPPIYMARRNNPFDHSSMVLDVNMFSMYVDSTRFFDKPIAVLMGPNAVSANDFIATQMRHHPRARFFGKPPASGYASYEVAGIDSICLAQYAWLNGYVLKDSVPQYLTHVEFQMDDKVWFTPEGAARGEDDVAKAALAWITSVTSVADLTNALTPSIFILNQNYPNPFNPTTVISYQLPSNNFVSLEVYDMLGRKIKALVNERQNVGHHSVTFNASGLSSGVYFYHLQAGSFSETKKLILLK